MAFKEEYEALPDDVVTELLNHHDTPENIMPLIMQHATAPSANAALSKYGPSDSWLVYAAQSPFAPREKIGELVERGCNLNFQFRQTGNTFAHHLLYNLKLSLLKDLLAKYPKISQSLHIQNQQGNAPIHIATAACSMENLSDTLIDLGAYTNINIQNRSGNTPLMHNLRVFMHDNRATLISDDEQHLHKMLDANPDIETTILNQQGNSLLNWSATQAIIRTHLAKKHGNSTIHKKVMNNEPLTDEDIRSPELSQASGTLQDTPLHMAALTHRTQQATDIIKNKPSLVHQTNARGEMPLHTTARVNSVPVAKILLDAGANPSQETITCEKDGDKMKIILGNTPLALSAYNNFSSLTQMFLKTGLVTYKDAFDAYPFVRRYNDKKTAQLLLTYRTRLKQLKSPMRLQKTLGKREHDNEQESYIIFNTVRANSLPEPIAQEIATLSLEE